MCVPALQRLREAVPSAHISILARPWVGAIYEREPFCDELIPYTAPRGWKGIRDYWSVSRDLKSRNFDCAVLFQNAFEAAALVAMAGIPERIGYDRDARGWLLTKAIAVPKRGEIALHQRSYYLELLKRAGMVHSYDASQPIRLSSASVAAEEGRKSFAAAGLRSPVVGVSPGASYGGAKRWLPDRFASAALQVARQIEGSVAVFGSAQESDICGTVAQLVAEAGVECVNFAGTTELGQFIGMAAACAVYLTNDSGPMHIASALGVRTVAVFGATDDIATGPTGEMSRVVKEPVECSPCLLRECPIDHRCMTRVSAEQVAATAIDLLK